MAYNKLDAKGFTKKLAWIKDNQGKLRDAIHDACMFALEQSLKPESNNATPAMTLMDVLDKSQRKEAVKAWLCHFGNLFADGCFATPRRAFEQDGFVMLNARSQYSD